MNLRNKFYDGKYRSETRTKIHFGEYGKDPNPYLRMETVLLPNCPECGKQIIQDSNNEILCKSCGLSFSEYDIYGIFEATISLKSH